jgi:hypothetical protein
MQFTSFFGCPHYLSLNTILDGLQYDTSYWSIFLLLGFFTCSFLVGLQIFLFIFNQGFPSIKEKHGEFMLRELVGRWLNHKVMMKWMLFFFNYLDKYFTVSRSLPSLDAIGIAYSRNLVCLQIPQIAPYLTI